MQVTIRVTEDLIQPTGTRYCGGSGCPVYWAATRAGIEPLHDHRMYVDTEGLGVMDKTDGVFEEFHMVAPFEAAVQDWLHDHDCGEPVFSIEFEVEIPDNNEYLRVVA